MSQHRIVSCSVERHAAAILDIFNDAIVNSTALYDYVQRPPESMLAWFETKRRGGFPVIGIEAEDGGGDGGRTLLAFGTWGTFRDRPAYKYTVEHSVYVHKDHRGHGLGRIVMQQLIDAARQADLHAMVGAIDAHNASSVALHTSLGFQLVGSMPQVGFKFGRWLDLALYQLLLDTPTRPIDG